MTPQRTALHLLSNRWNSAITEYALSAAMALKGQGWRCVFSPLGDSPAESRSVGLGLETKSVPRYSAGGVLEVSKLLQDVKPDVIMTYGGPETLLARIGRRLNPGVKVVRFRGHEVPEGQLFFKERHRLSHSHCDLIVTPASFLTEILRPASTCPVETVTLGVDAEKYRCRDFDVSRSRDVVILGRLDPVKGHKEFMKTFATILRAWSEPSWRPRLHIIGEPANLSVLHLQQSAAEAGLRLESELKISPVRVANISEILSTAVAGVVSSIGSEIICRVAEEFLMCGTPIAVSGAGSLNEVLAEPGFGISWSGWSDSQTAETLDGFFKSSFGEAPATRKLRADQARRHFSYEAMGQRLISLI